MNALTRLLLPALALSFADDGGAGGGGSQDGKPSGAEETPPAKPAGDKPGDAEKVTLDKKDYDRLQGRLGQLEDAERRRADDKKKADEEEAKKRGDHEKLLAERDKEIAGLKLWQERYAARVAADYKRRSPLIAKCNEKAQAQFRKAADGKELTLEDMEHNLAKLDEYEELGLVTGAADRVVLPQDKTRTVTVTDGNGPPAFDPWK